MGAAEVGAAETQGHQQERIIVGILGRNPIHSTKTQWISVRSNRKSFEKTGPPFEVGNFSRSDRSEFWLNGSSPQPPL